MSCRFDLGISKTYRVWSSSAAISSPLPGSGGGGVGLSRCYEGTEASARAWLEVAAVAYLFARLRVEPP